MKKIKIPRLFVPLNSEPYTWFISGNKSIELRNYGRQYTEKHVYPGRVVELRKGYGKSSTPLWGVIKKVSIYPSLEETMKREDYNKIIPTAYDSEDALKKISQILNVTKKDSSFIAFEIKLLKEPQFIEFQAHYLNMLKRGEKTTTIRLDWRPYKMGSCIAYSTLDSIVLTILNVRHLRLRDLQVGNAYKDGFKSVDQFYEALQLIYPSINQDSKITLIEFGGKNGKY